MSSSYDDGSILSSSEQEYTTCFITVDPEHGKQPDFVNTGGSLILHSKNDVVLPAHGYVEIDTGIDVIVPRDMRMVLSSLPRKYAADTPLFQVLTDIIEREEIGDVDDEDKEKPPPKRPEGVKQRIKITALNHTRDDVEIRRHSSVALGVMHIQPIQVDYAFD